MLVSFEDTDFKKMLNITATITLCTIFGSKVSPEGLYQCEADGKWRPLNCLVHFVYSTLNYLQHNRCFMASIFILYSRKKNCQGFSPLLRR